MGRRRNRRRRPLPIPRVRAAIPLAPSLRAASRRLLHGAPDERLVAPCGAVTSVRSRRSTTATIAPLLGFCRHMLGSREEAEDALQQVFVSAHRHLPGAAVTSTSSRGCTRSPATAACRSCAHGGTMRLEPAHEPSTTGPPSRTRSSAARRSRRCSATSTGCPTTSARRSCSPSSGSLAAGDRRCPRVRTAKVKALIFQAREALAGWRRRARPPIAVRSRVSSRRCAAARCAARRSGGTSSCARRARRSSARSRASVPRSACCSR